MVFGFLVVMSWMDDLPDKMLTAEHEEEAKNTRKVLGVKSARAAPNTAQRAARLLRRGPQRGGDNTGMSRV